MGNIFSWFLDNPDHNWTPPAALLDWMAKARADNKPIVYIGFGSITVPNPPAVTRSIVKSVLKSKIYSLTQLVRRNRWKFRCRTPMLIFILFA